MLFIFDIIIVCFIAVFQAVILEAILLVTMATANLTPIQSCCDIYLSQFYIPKKYEECSIHIIFDVTAVLSLYHSLPATR